MSVCVLQNREKIRVLWTDFFSFLSRNKSVFSFKNRSRTCKTDDFSSPGVNSLGHFHLIDALWSLSTISCFAAIFVKGNNFCEFLFASLEVMLCQ